MSNRIHIICHANSGQGNGRKILKKVTAILDSYRINYIIYKTNYSTHAEIIAEQIIHKGYRECHHQLMVIGGDGTLHEVVDSLMRNQSLIPITYIPAGTGNDFYNTWQKDKTIQTIIQSMLFDRKIKTIPIFKFQEKISNRSGIIINNMGYGFDALVNAKVNHISKNQLNKLMGFKKMNYLISLFSSLPHLKPFKVSGYIDQKPFEIERGYVAAILNSPFAGGGICLDGLTNPEAKEITLVIYHSINFSNALGLLKKLLVDKQPQESKNVTRMTGQTLNLRIHKPIIGHVDGEVIPENIADIQVTISSYPFYL